MKNFLDTPQKVLADRRYSRAEKIFRQLNAFHFNRRREFPEESAKKQRALADRMSRITRRCFRIINPKALEGFE